MTSNVTRQHHQVEYLIQVLALLSDLLENSLLIQFIHGWRSSKTLQSTAKLLCRAWLDEEARLGCIRPGVLSLNGRRKCCYPSRDCVGGVLAEREHPLGSHLPAADQGSNPSGTV